MFEPLLHVRLFQWCALPQRQNLSLGHSCLHPRDIVCLPAWLCLGRQNSSGPHPHELDGFHLHRIVRAESSRLNFIDPVLSGDEIDGVSKEFCAQGADVKHQAAPGHHVRMEEMTIRDILGVGALVEAELDHTGGCRVCGKPCAHLYGRSHPHQYRNNIAL